MLPVWTDRDPQQQPTVQSWLWLVGKRSLSLPATAISRGLADFHTAAGLQLPEESHSSELKSPSMK